MHHTLSCFYFNVPHVYTTHFPLLSINVYLGIYIVRVLVVSIGGGDEGMGLSTGKVMLQIIPSSIGRINDSIKVKSMSMMTVSENLHHFRK